jgi:hypothetical protein
MSKTTYIRETTRKHDVVQHMVITRCPKQWRISQHVEALGMHADWKEQQEEAA